MSPKTNGRSLLTLTLALACSVAIAGAAAQNRQNQRPPERAGLFQISWLAGNWKASEAGASIEERWTAPAGGAMLAVSRTVKANQMVAFEFLRIVERDGTLVYIAQPNGRPPVEFALTRLADSSATFENPAHDFPKLIRYTQRENGTLEAVVSDGGPNSQTFEFRRDP